MFSGNHEICVTGKALRIARLRHEWCEFLQDPLATIKDLQQKGGADVFTFFHDLYETQPAHPFLKEAATASVLTINTHKQWWDGLDFKVRNKVRKAQKSGVELRVVQLDDEFARGVEGIYNESPIRQGRKFWHYGKKMPEIKKELSSFLDRCTFVGAYFQGELIGFMKVWEGKDVLRTIHIIAKVSQRDKPVMDALIAQAVELCDEKKIHHLQYGSWATGSLGVFRAKHGFERVEVPRYFVPLNLRGKLMLKLRLHHPIRDHLPERWAAKLIAARTRWSMFRYQRAKAAASSADGLVVERCK